MPGVQVGEEAPDLGAEHALERQRRLLDDRHVQPELARRRRDLGADPAAADDDQPPARLQARGERVGVGHGAQVMDAGEVGARHAQAARLGAGGQQQALVGDALAAGQHDLERVHVDPVDLAPVRRSMALSA